MNTVTIIFAGLIAHVLTAGGVQRAVIVAAPNHAARLIVRSTDIVSESGPPLGEDSGAPEGERWFNIAGSTIKFGGLPAGIPVVDASFAEHIAPLSMISDATEIRPEIDSGRLFGGAVGYVDLPSGTLSGRELFPQQVTFERSRWLGAKCLARHVVFVAQAPSDTIQVRVSSGSTIVIRARAVLRVENEPTSSLAPHFHMYEQLLVKTGSFALPSMTGNTCDVDVPEGALSTHRGFGSKLRPEVAASSECSNSQWP